MSGPNRPAIPLPEVPALSAPNGFEERLRAIGVALDSDVLARMGDYLARLLAMNAHVNLTSITDPDEAWERHVLDALSLLPILADAPAGARVLDVGSGGGVPGIPLAIARPDLRVTLLEATEKKVGFLRDVATALGLTSLDVVSGRAEQLATTELARSFDVVTARAVAKVPALVPWTAPFAKNGGRLILIKGQRADQELSDARAVLRRYRCGHERTIPTPTGRVIVLRVA